MAKVAHVEDPVPFTAVIGVEDPLLETGAKFRLTPGCLRWDRLPVALVWGVPKVVTVGQIDRTDQSVTQSENVVTIPAPDTDDKRVGWVDTVERSGLDLVGTGRMEKRWARVIRDLERQGYPTGFAVNVGNWGDPERNHPRRFRLDGIRKVILLEDADLTAVTLFGIDPHKDQRGRRRPGRRIAQREPDRTRRRSGA